MHLEQHDSEKSSPVSGVLSLLNSLSERALPFISAAALAGCLNGCADHVTVEGSGGNSGNSTSSAEGGSTTTTTPSPTTTSTTSCDVLKVSIDPQDSQVVAQGATNVPLGCLRFDNGCKPNSNDSLLFQVKGLDASKAFSDITLGSAIAGPHAQLNGKTFAFANVGENQPADSEWGPCVFADIAVDAPLGDVRISLDSAKDIGTTAPQVEGDFPLEGGWITVGNAKVGSLTIAKEQGDISIQPGASVDLDGGRFIIATSPQEDGKTYSIWLTLKGDNCDISNLSNFRLLAGYAPGDVFTPIAQTQALVNLTGNSPNLDFETKSPAKLLADQNTYFRFKFDGACPPGTGFHSCVAKEDDVLAKGAMTGQGMFVVDHYSCTPGQETIVTFQ